MGQSAQHSLVLAVSDGKERRMGRDISGLLKLNYYNPGKDLLTKLHQALRESLFISNNLEYLFTLSFLKCGILEFIDWFSCRCKMGLLFTSYNLNSNEFSELFKYF